MKRQEERRGRIKEERMRINGREGRKEERTGAKGRRMEGREGKGE